MPADVAVHQPSTGIVCQESNDKIPANRRCRHIATRRVVNAERDGSVVGSVFTTGEDEEVMTVQMDWM